MSRKNKSREPIKAELVKSYNEIEIAGNKLSSANNNLTQALRLAEVILGNDELRKILKELGRDKP